jgi:hypothetical protein
MKNNIEGQLIHSKKATKKFPKDVDYTSFINKIIENSK